MDYGDQIRKLLKSEEIKSNVNVILLYALKSLYVPGFARKSKYFSKSLLRFLAKQDISLIETSLFDESKIIDNQNEDIFNDTSVFDIESVAFKRNSFKSTRNQSVFMKNDLNMLDLGSILRSEPLYVINKIIEYERDYILDRDDEYILLNMIKNYIYSDEDPRTSQLMTSYNIFSSSIELIFCLKLIDSLPSVPGNPREFPLYESFMDNIKARVWLFFTHWVKIYREKYQKNKLIQSLLKGKIGFDDSSFLDLCSITLSEPILPLRLFTINKILNEGIFFFDVNEIAKQLCLIDHYLLSNLKIDDFKKFIKNQEMPETIQQIFLREKQFKCYILTFILTQDTLEDKKNAIQNFILLSNACRLHNNFQTAYTILSCLMKVNSTKKKHLFIEKKFREIYVNLENEFHDIELQDFSYSQEFKKSSLPIIPNILNLIYHMHHLITLSKSKDINDQMRLAKKYKEFFLDITDILRKRFPFFKISPIYEFLEFGILEYLRPKTWNLKFKGELNYLEEFEDYDKILEFLYEKFKKIDN